MNSPDYLKFNLIVHIKIIYHIPPSKEGIKLIQNIPLVSNKFHF